LVCFLLKTVGCSLAQWAINGAYNVVGSDVAENENCGEVPILIEPSPWTSTVISTLLETPMWESEYCTIIDVTSGRWNGLRAIGVGSNMKARKRASRLAICIAVLAGCDSQEAEDKMRVNLSEDPLMLSQMRTAVTQVKECLARGPNLASAAGSQPAGGPIGAPPGISPSPMAGHPISPSPGTSPPKAGGRLPPPPPPPPPSVARCVAPPAPAGQPPLSALFGPPGPPPEHTDEASSSKVRRSLPLAPREPPPAQGIAPAPPPPPQQIPVDSKENQAAAGPPPEPRIVSVAGSMSIQSRGVPPATPPKSQPPLLGAEDKHDDVHPPGVDQVDDASLLEHFDINGRMIETPETPENEGSTMVTASSGSSAPQGSGKDRQAVVDFFFNLRDGRNLRSRSRSKH
jgi:hypothetical protein